jgi:hypothetical protein
MSGKPSTKGRKSSASTKQKRKSVSDKTSKAKSSGWEFAPFTIKAVAFTQTAKKLAAYVHHTYGDGISIAAFEKFAVAADSFSKEEAAIVHLDPDGIRLLIDYQKARDARDAERQAFRSDVQVKDVEGAMASLLTKFVSHHPKGDNAGPNDQGPGTEQGGPVAMQSENDGDL